MYDSNWYDHLAKPFLSPPNWVFVPVWTILYIIMFVALIIYFLKPSYNKKGGYIYFGIQLFLNFLWSPVFFMYQNISLALVVILLLDIFVFFTMRRFYMVSKVSGALFIPYFLWILFATYLNLSYVLLN